MSLRVLDPGLYSLAVDYGRPNCRSLGIPVGGAADRTSLMLGNALAGNRPDAAALEVCLHGPTLQAECELACVVYGAPFELKSKRQRLQAGKTFTLESGDILEIGGTYEGMRAYLCVGGGIRNQEILGSRSSLAPVAKDDVLDCLPQRIPGRFALIGWRWDAEATGRKCLRVLDGTQSDWFDTNGLIAASGEPPSFKVSQSSNRMGLRLEGNSPFTFPAKQMLSEPVCPGTVQVTRDGQCIILGVDGQTIGGYPKIAQVVSADLDVLGQLRPGEEISFRRVSLEEAERLYRAKLAEVKHWVARIRAAVG